MVVQHNMKAMNANRMLGITQGTLAKSTEKLSSGYKVNRAADDAAGLSISEKMRKQIRGLNQASANAEDGISAVQTAEGALTEVHDMLQRMNELANKAANGTNSEADRQTIQDEISQLTTEIDRVAETTKFNETYLLKGDGTKGTKTLDAHDAGLAGKLVDNGNGKSTFTADALEVGDSVNIGGTEYNIVDSARADEYESINDKKFNHGDKIVQDGVTYTVSIGEGKSAYLQGDRVTAIADAGTETKATTNANDAVKFVDEDGNAVTFTIKEGATVTTTLGVTTTLVGKQGTAIGLSKNNTLNTAGNRIDETGTAVAWKAGDKIIDEEGTEYTYVEAGKTLNNVTHANAGFYKSEGNKGADAAYKIEAGDTYVLKETGETDKIAAGGIATVETIQDQIKYADSHIKTTANGAAKVTIMDSANDAGKTYMLGVTQKEDGSVYTADDVASMVQEGSYAKIELGTYNAGTWATTKGASHYYAVASESDSKTDVSLKKAYEMMADELEAASSIGADTDATVKNNGDGSFEITQGKVEIDNALSFSLHVGADADMTNKIGVNIQTMSSAGLGVKNLNVADDSGKAATYAIDAISDAIETVSKQRSLLGAVQNRLEHTINNLDNVAENTTSAESAIRDTDMATEMVKYSNANILAQAGQSMLAQANQSNQGVLSLLG